MKEYDFSIDNRLSALQVNDIVVTYVNSGTSQNKLTWAILGGKTFLDKMPGSTLDFVSAGQQGIPKKSVIHLADFLNIPLKEVASLLNISYKTLGRKKPLERMDTLSSSLSIEIASTMARGYMVFENAEKFNRWLHKKNKALEGKTPYELLNTPTGINIVNKLLTRIEEGVYT